MQQPHADDNLHHRGRDKRIRSHDYSVFTTKKDEINGLLGKYFSASERGNRACRQVGDEAANRLLRIEKIDGLGNVRGISDRAHLGHS